jgi:hypothetical protein
MPQRRDKRDMIALSAYLSGLEIEFVDGVNGTLISKQERPDVGFFYLHLLSMFNLYHFT